MSLTAKRYLTVDAKALRVLACCGKAPNLLKGLDADECTSVAALCDVAGKLVEDGQEQFRLLLVAHYDRLKATVAELDEPAPKSKRQRKEKPPTPELSE